MFPPLTSVSSSLYLCGGVKIPPRFTGVRSYVGFLPGLTTTIIGQGSGRFLKVMSMLDYLTPISLFTLRVMSMLVYRLQEFGDRLSDYNILTVVFAPVSYVND